MIMIFLETGIALRMAREDLLARSISMPQIPVVLVWASIGLLVHLDQMQMEVS
jgi:hypothetical protein